MDEAKKHLGFNKYPIQIHKVEDRLCVQVTGGRLACLEQKG